MENSDLFKSQKLSFERMGQRDSARAERDTALEERDSALEERDSARVERDDNSSAQRQFIATISHDLRNPIAAIKMALEIVRGEASDTMKQEMFALMERNADQAGILITQLLDAHLIKSGGKLPLIFAYCDVVAILKKCQDSLAPKDQVKINFDINQKSHICGGWDAGALERAFKNLISNALKFSADGQDIHVRVWQGPDITCISVQNFGEIISLENQLRIFENHYRVESTAFRDKGWGLGLTLVRGIAEAHNGKVEVTSSKTEGTIFTIKIPNIL